MTAYEVLLSESQERMLLVIRPEAVPAARAILDRYELAAAEIGRIVDEPAIVCVAGGEVVCRVPGRALADAAPRYDISGSPAVSPRDVDLEPLAAEPAGASVLLELLAAPNARDRKPVWRRYDHMNGTNTLVGPGAGDAALLRVKGTPAAIALALDGPGPARLGALDPYLAGASAVLEGALNVACTGATPIGITDCLNFGSPETDRGAWQLERAIDGIADACRALDVPVVSGNVSLYNETPEGPILPTPIVGTVGLLEDRRAALRMAWIAGDDVWLLGAPDDDAAILAGSELAWRRGLRGGSPALDVAAAARVAWIVPRLARIGLVTGAHDCSTGGLGVALARMAIASALGAAIDLATSRPTAALFGERGGRAIVASPAGRRDELSAAVDAAGVPARRIGAAGGDALVVRASGEELAIDVASMSDAWGTAF